MGREDYFRLFQISVNAEIHHSLIDSNGVDVFWDQLLLHQKLQYVIDVFHGYVCHWMSLDFKVFGDLFGAEEGICYRIQWDVSG